MKRPEAAKLSSLFTPRQILCHVEGLACEQLVLRLIDLVAVENESLNAGDIHQNVLKRESCGVALVCQGVAVIHVRAPHLDRVFAAMATTRGGLCCSVGAGSTGCRAGEELSTVGLVVLMLAPLDDPAGYLRSVAALSRSCLDKGFLDKLLAIDDPVEVWQLFDRQDLALPAYITAADIMSTDFPCLRTDDTLNTAIDMFCTLGLSEIPVADADGDFAGIVTEDELLRVCLPEYITWMEDLSPVLNFEPFAEILRQESSLPILEIMLFPERYATVDEQTPAIQVAKIMMRRDVRQVYVVRDKRLIGVVTIHDFIHKVLRA
ncbi:MAG: CBS domain-containing protein [Gammaproteobacteria bacterium]